MLTQSRLKYYLRVPLYPVNFSRDPWPVRVRTNNILFQSRLKYKLLNPWIDPAGEFHGIKLSNNMLYLKIVIVLRNPSRGPGENVTRNEYLFWKNILTPLLL